MTRGPLIRECVLYRGRQDKKRGITDCISFVTMRDRDLQAALTTDRDFDRAGFTALLRP